MRLAHLFRASIAIAMLSAPAVATKLDKPICDELKVELGSLQKKGVSSDLAKGPEWAKTNASAERLKEIERLIHVEEQLAFRCPQPKRAPAPGEDDDGNVTAAPAKGAKVTAQAKAASPAAKTQAGQSKSAAADPDAAPAAPKKASKAPSADQPPAKQASASSPPRAVPKAKQKHDDAYSPASTGQSSSSGFQSNN
jgi:hypothetical protein